VLFLIYATHGEVCTGYITVLIWTFRRFFDIFFSGLESRACSAERCCCWLVQHGMNVSSAGSIFDSQVPSDEAFACRPLTHVVTLSDRMQLCSIQAALHYYV